MPETRTVDRYVDALSKLPAQGRRLFAIIGADREPHWSRIPPAEWLVVDAVCTDLNMVVPTRRLPALAAAMGARDGGRTESQLFDPCAILHADAGVLLPLADRVLEILAPVP